MRTRQKKYNKKKQTNTTKTSKQCTRQDIPLYKKVMISLLTYGVKLLALLGSPCCHSLLLPLLRWPRELLASSCLLWSSCFVVVVYSTSGWNGIPSCSGLCSWSVQNHPHWLEKGNFLSSPLTKLAILRVHPTPYQSRATIRVPPTPYRPRVTVAAIDHIAATAQAVKEQFPSLVARRQLSFQA